MRTREENPWISIQNFEIWLWKDDTRSSNDHLYGLDFCISLSFELSLNIEVLDTCGSKNLHTHITK